MSGVSRWFFGLLDALGVNRLLNWLDGRKVVILCYHGVIDHAHGRRRLGIGTSHLAPRDLERHVRVIQRRHRIISFDEAVDMLSGARPFKRNCVVLTFDDGYRNNATQAAPILERLGATATFFLATRFVDERRPLWFDRLEHVVATADCPEIAVQLNEETMRRPLNGEAGRRAALGAIKGRLKPLGARSAERAVEALEEQMGTRLAESLEQDEWTAPMSWEQARSLARRGFSIGSHTVNHEMLARAPAAVAAQELRDSRAMIERELGQACLLFCYPNGDHDDASVAETRAAGYRAAVITRWGYARPEDDLFQLKRISVQADIPDAKLLAALSGLLPLVLRLRDALRRRAEPAAESDS